MVYLQCDETSTQSGQSFFLRIIHLFRKNIVVMTTLFHFIIVFEISTWPTYMISSNPVQIRFHCFYSLTNILYLCCSWKFSQFMWNEFLPVFFCWRNVLWLASELHFLSQVFNHWTISILRIVYSFVGKWGSSVKMFQ